MIIMYRPSAKFGIPVFIVYMLLCYVMGYSDISRPGEMSTPMAAWPKIWVRGRFLFGIAGSKPAGGMDVCLFCVLCVVR